MTPPLRGEWEEAQAESERGLVSLLKRAVGWLKNTFQKLLGR